MATSWCPLIALMVTVLLSQVHTGIAENSYVVYIPKHIRPGQPINFVCSILENTNSTAGVSIASNLHLNDEYDSYDNDLQLIMPGESAMISTVEIPLNITRSSKITLKILGFDPETGAEIFFNETSDFYFSEKSQSTFIQTDKALYQPGQTMKFRAAFLDYELKPKNTTATFEIQDPKRNVIMLKKNQPTTMGVMGDELEIHADSPLGMWKIRVTDEETDYMEEIEYEVKKYKLPKFEVEIESPSYVYQGQEGVTFKLKAKYTYGKPVEGEGMLKVQVVDSWTRPFFGGDFVLRGPTGRLQVHQPDLETTIFRNFNGSAEMFLSVQQLEKMGWKKGAFYSKKLQVFGSVTEQYTGIEFNASKSVDLKDKYYKIEQMYTPLTAKPGLMYTAYLKVVQHDGEPVNEEFRRNNKVGVHITSWTPSWGFEPIVPMVPLPEVVDYTDDGEPVIRETVIELPPPPKDIDAFGFYEISPNGEVVVEFQVPDQRFYEMNFKASVNSSNDNNELYWDAKQAHSPSDSFLQISTKNTVFEAGNTATFTVKSNKVIKQLTFMVKSRGNLIQQEDRKYDGDSKEIEFELEITSSMQPSCTLLVSTVAQSPSDDFLSFPPPVDGEIVADYIQFTVQTSLQNQVTMTSSSTNVDAGDDVTIKVKTSQAGSYVGLKAVDKSVLLLKTGNDITMEKVDDNMQTYSVDRRGRFNRRWWWWPTVNEGQDAHQIFQDANLNILTDAYLYEKEEEKFAIMAFVANEASRGAPPNTAFLMGGAKQAAEVSKPRSYFPETWLWTDAITNEDGTAEFTQKTPDTITSWVLNAFSISPESGLGIAEESQITVFRNFFVSLNLPLKVTRGEIIIVQALVFNYFNMDVEVTLKLHENDSGFELIMPVDDENIAGRIRRFTVTSQSSYSVSFPVRMTSIGDVELQISASSLFAADSVIRKISVSPEGIQQCFSQSVLINRHGGEKDASSHELEVKIPKGVVHGSENVKMFVYGDIMGSTTQNLGSLLREPTGCGEQNMQSFAPDVFVTSYLQKAGRLDDETREKAYKHFVQGYQNQLNYRHDDGSYSAFGDNDKSGSLWLTAFVTKCFIHAGNVRPEMAQQLQRSIDTAFEFIADQIESDGSYTEPGRVSARYMQGGVDSKITMAAYVLITLTEAYVDRSSQGKTPLRPLFGILNPKPTVGQMAARTRRFLEDNLDDVKTKPYALSIVTYALHTSGSEKAAEALQALEALATTSDGQKYWHEEDQFSSKYSDDRSYYYRPPSNDIEMTSYALLTYVRNDDINSAVPVLKWLASKRNELGGYSSTQNTVIAIQALSAVAGMIDHQNQDITVNIKGGVHFNKNINIKQDNVVVFNRFDLPGRSGKWQISAEGSGLAVAQLSVCYHVTQTPFSDSPFDCKMQISDGDVDGANLMFCCSLKESVNESTGMLLYEINLPNGFSVDLNLEHQENKEAKKVELKKGSANYYYDELNKGDVICSSTHLKRQEKVGANKPSTIIVQDYYQPERRFFTRYSIGDLENAEACTICGSDCAGCPAAYLTDWKLSKPCLSVCGDDYEEYQRSCYDPNINQEVNAYKCGVDELPTKRSLCYNRKLPKCPYLHEGLWGMDQADDGSFLNFGPRSRVKFCSKEYDFPSFVYMPSLSFGVTPKARVDVNGKLGFDGIPSVSLQDRFYLSCHSDLFANMELDKGFTVSMMVYINEYSTTSDTVFFSYGVFNDDEEPNFILSRSYWGTRSRKQLTFRANVGGVLYRITRIPSDLFIKKWVHLVVTWHPTQGHHVYINGKSYGFRFQFRSRKAKKIPDFGRFLVGRSTEKSKKEQGYLNGHVSSLALWNQRMVGDQVKEIYHFYEDMITDSNGGKEPAFSPFMMNFLAQPLRQNNPEVNCFNETMTLSQIEARRNEKEIDCWPYY